MQMGKTTGDHYSVIVVPRPFADTITGIGSWLARPSLCTEVGSPRKISRTNRTSNADPDSEQEAPGLYGGPGRPNVQIGFPDREGGGNGSWNSSHGTRGCSQPALPRTHGIGQFYCFAVTGEN